MRGGGGLVNLRKQVSSVLCRTYGDVNILRRRTGARDLDRFTISSVDRPITIPCPRRVNPRLESQLRCEFGDSGGIQGPVHWGFVIGGIVGRRVLGWRVRRRSDVSSVVDRLLQSTKLCGREWATFSRAIQVLNSDRGGRDPSGFILLRIACRERNLDRRVIDRESSLNVLDQSLKDQGLRTNRVRNERATHGDVNVRSWRTRTRNLDRLPVGTVNGTIAISSSSGIEPGSEPKFRRELSNSRSIWNARLSLHLQRCGERG